jgi:hypothetical protein
MANRISAEPVAGSQCNSSDDNHLTQQSKSSGSLNQPLLRIVHNADRFQAPSSVNMAPPERPRQTRDRPPAMLDRTVQAQIGRLLRDVFADVAGEPVPERFITLLAQLETRESPR